MSLTNHSLKGLYGEYEGTFNSYMYTVVLDIVKIVCLVNFIRIFYFMHSVSLN